jgi:lipopolysaccharide/colanic/teichoic acid biosynthesis glycosyltransferase
VADPVIALVALVLLSPVVLAISIAIVIDDGRPVFFLSARSGKGERTFRMVKFRTMVRNAIELGREMKLSEDPFGIVPDDPRVTKVGRWLRRTGLDELPQLWNVLCLQMSLVGPRADIVEQVENYTPEERRRLAVLPGITGWAQVHGRDSIPWPERFRLDLWYIDHWSLGLDLRILGLTVREVFRPDPEPIVDAMNIERAKARAEGGTKP